MTEFYVGQKIKLIGRNWSGCNKWNLDTDKIVTIKDINDDGFLYFKETDETDEADAKYHWWVEVGRGQWGVEPVKEERFEAMRYLIAVEGHRDYDTYFIDIDEEMTKAHPDLVFKMGEILGLYSKYGGILKDGTE
jgi:hypothetical protein